MSLTGALLSWSSSCFRLPLSTASDCADGVFVAKMLNAIDHQHFSQKWAAGIKGGGANVRLRTANVKKLLSAMDEYYGRVLCMDGVTQADLIRPNPDGVAKAEEDDVGERLTALTSTTYI